jgi:hypothetical protein
MNKATLAEAMGIKLNTLNVNLHDLNFVQLQRDKSGWTFWKRAGFTRTANSLELDSGPSSGRTARPPVNGFLGKSPTISFTLGRLADQQTSQFMAETQRLWGELLQCSATSPVAIDRALDSVAERFRYPEQPLQNARDVLDAIIRPSCTDGKFTFTDFCRLLAMLGPERTVMAKIASLLTNSNSTGQWLTFEREGIDAAPCTFFDWAMPNCLVVRHAGMVSERVYNVPTAEAQVEVYPLDDFGKAYRDWDEWFSTHPVRYADIRTFGFA